MRTTFVKERAFTCALLQIFRIFVSKAPLKLPPPSNFKVFAKLLERVTSQGKNVVHLFSSPPTKLRWRDLRSQLCFFLFLSGKEKGYFWKHWIVFSCTASFLGQLLPCYALVHERRPRFCHRDLLSLLAINKSYVFQWGQKTFLGVPKQKWRRVLIHKFFALSGLQNCNRKLSLIQIFFRAGIKTKYLLFA